LLDNSVALAQQQPTTALLDPQEALYTIAFEFEFDIDTDFVCGSIYSSFDLDLRISAQLGSRLNNWIGLDWIGYTKTRLEDPLRMYGMEWNGRLINHQPLAISHDTPFGTHEPEPEP
jgi:hypothetical protein